MSATDVLIWTADFIKDRPVYPIVRRALNLLFVASITSWWYTQCYEGILLRPLVEKTDWYNYLLKGEYFIPVSMFIIVFVLTWIVPFLIYKALTIGLGVKIKRMIIRYQATHDDALLGAGAIEKVGRYFTEKKLDEKAQAELYQQLKQNVKEDELNDMKAELEKGQDMMYDNFIMVFRMLIAALVYSNLLPQFSLWLTVVLVIVLVIILVNLLVAGLMFDILPVLANKLDTIANSFYETKLNVPEEKKD